MVQKQVYFIRDLATDVIEQLLNKDAEYHHAYERSNNAKKITYHEFVDIVTQYCSDYVELLHNHNINATTIDDYDLEAGSGLYNLYKYYKKSLENDFIVMDITPHFIDEKIKDFVDFATNKAFLLC